MKAKDLEKVVKDFMKYFDPKVKVEIDPPATPERSDGGRGEPARNASQRDAGGGESWNVKIDAANSGLLIGRFGETLNSFQHLVRLMAVKLAGERVSLSVDIGDYKGKKNREIEELAMAVAENVKNSGYAQTLRPMNSYERRIVHVVLKDAPGVEVASVGEEPYRCVEIKPKKK